jgi:SAM-dependent methyltransferase
MLFGLLKRRPLVGPVKAAAEPNAGAIAPARMMVLNVGGGTKKIPIPQHYAGWDHLLLDIDPQRSADIVCDARDLLSLEQGTFDAVYCSHNLEHYYRHEVSTVLAGFSHVLRDGGFAEVRVPDMPAVFRKMVEDGMDLGDVLYQSPGGPIQIIDVIYGWGQEIERSGNDFYAHKTGFSRKLLREALHAAGFTEIWEAPPLAQYELRACAFKQSSSPAQRSLLGIPLDARGVEG